MKHDDFFIPFPLFSMPVEPTKFILQTNGSQSIVLKISVLILESIKIHAKQLKEITQVILTSSF